MRSVDGHALPIAELRGTKPVESLDLSGEDLGFSSGVIIAACIKENAILRELKCAPTFACTKALFDPYSSTLQNRYWPISSLCHVCAFCTQSPAHQPEHHDTANHPSGSRKPLYPTLRMTQILGGGNE